MNDTAEKVIEHHETWRHFLSSDGINQGMPFVVYPGEMLLLIAEFDKLKARVGELELAVEAVLPAMLAYKKNNPRYNHNGVEQDPNGVHAWLDAQYEGL